MNPARIACIGLLSSLCLVSSEKTMIASLIENVSLNTAPLIGSTAGPFSLDFQLNGSADNTAILSGFSFGHAGGALGSPMLAGGASGSLSSSVVLTETGFLNEFTQPFQPGSLLSFNLVLSTHQQPKAFPDELTFAILDRTGAELPTTSFSDVFLSVDITALPKVEVFGSDPKRMPRAGGPPLGISPATVEAATGVPEPGTLVPVSAGLLGVVVTRILTGKNRRK